MPFFMEYKEIVKKLITRKNITEEDLNIFLTTYISENDKTVTSKQLQTIKQLIASGAFSLSYAVMEAVKKLNLTIISVLDLNTNNILRVDVYEQ